MKETHQKMTISRFAKAGGVGKETIRFYQRRGLLPIPGPGTTSYREYDDGLLEQLRFIRKAQLAGFTLEEIKELIKLDPKRDHSRIQEMTQKRLSNLSVEISELQEIFETLQYMLDECNQSGHNISCPIIQTLGTNIIKS